MRKMITCGALLAATATFSGAVGAQTWQRGGEGWCDEDWGGDRDRFCEVLTAVVGAPGRLDIDGGLNGGVTVEGWDRSDVEVRAKVWANARSMDRAQELARQVRVRADGGRIDADGPSTGRRESWGVSYEVRVPHDTDLDIRTHNGGVSITAVSGDIAFNALNGGVRLIEVGGDVHGRTTNGGVRVELAGDRWAGRGLDVETTNGGVDLLVPDGFDAELVAGTVNGGFDIDFPITVRGRIGRQLRTTLGDGGPEVRAVTTNGGVRIRRWRR